MADTRDGSELTSAISKKSTPEGVGDTAKGGSASDDYFADIESDGVETREEQNRKLVEEQEKQRQLAEQKKLEAENLKKAEEEEPEQEEEEDALRDEKQETEQKKEEVGEEEGEVIEVEPDQADYLLSLEKDQLVAWGVKHHKGEKAWQSKLDKVRAVVGSDFITAIEAGKVPKQVGVLINDLGDESFQKHIETFYDSHELRDGKYVRTKNIEPTADALTEYGELILQKAGLNVTQFIDDEYDFDYNEAIKNPVSKSGVAWGKYEARRREIDSKIQDIQNRASVNTQKASPLSDEERARIGKQSMDALIDRYPDLKDETEQTNFQNFISENSRNALEVYYQAYKGNGRVKKEMKRFILKEMGTIQKNKESAEKQVQKAKKVTTTTTKPKYDNAGIEEDAKYFGDYD